MEGFFVYKKHVLALLAGVFVEITAFIGVEEVFLEDVQTFFVFVVLTFFPRGGGAREQHSFFRVGFGKSAIL